MARRRFQITPLTLYNEDQSVFDGITLPDYHFPRSAEYEDLFLREGWTLQKDVLINNILLETAELDTIYTDPEFFKFAVTQWAAKEYPVWRALYETLFYKYNPIWNKDGTVKETAAEVRDLLQEGEKARTQTGTSVNNSGETIEDTDNTTTENTETDSVNTVDAKHSTTAGTTSENKINVTSGSDAETETGTGSETKAGNQVNVKSGSEGTDTTEDETVENAVSAFDSMSTYTPKDKSERDAGSTEAKSISENNVGTSSETSSNDSSRTNDKSSAGVNSEISSGSTSGSAEDLGTRTEQAARQQNGSDNRSYNRERSSNDSTVNHGSESETNKLTDSGSIDRDTERREFGNIGVTTTQAMIQAERDLVRFNLYDLIIDSFKARFCILLY